MCILNKNNSRLRGIPPEETFGILLKQGSMCKSELHSSVHFRRTPEILQRSKGRRYKIKYMNGKNSSESYRCPANKISTVLDSFTFCSDDHLPHAHRNNLKPECCYQCDLSVAHGSPAQCHQLFLQPQRSQRVQRAGLCARRPRTAPSPGAPALPPPLPGPLPPAVPPCPGEAAPERPPRVAAPDTGAGTGRWPGRGADGAGSGPGRAPSPFSPCPQGPRAQSSGMEAGWRQRPAGSALPAAPRAMLLTGARIRASGGAAAAGDKARGGGKAGAPGRPGPPLLLFLFLLLPSRLTWPRRDAEPRAGRCRGSRAPAPPQPGRVAVRAKGGGACAAPGERRGRVPLCAGGQGQPQREQPCEARACWGAARSVRTWGVSPPRLPRPRCQPGQH